MLLTEFTLLVLCVYHEARGEPDLGRQAVVHVVLNRVLTKGQSITAVIMAEDQFSFVQDGKIPPVDDDTSFAACAKSVVAAINIRVDKGFYFRGVDHYHKTDIQPWWAEKLIYVDTIGNHKFYRSK